MLEEWADAVRNTLEERDQLRKDVDKLQTALNVTDMKLMVSVRDAESVRARAEHLEGWRTKVIEQLDGYCVNAWLSDVPAVIGKLCQENSALESKARNLENRIIVLGHEIKGYKHAYDTVLERWSMLRIWIRSCTLDATITFGSLRHKVDQMTEEFKVK